MRSAFKQLPIPVVTMVGVVGEPQKTAGTVGQRRPRATRRQSYAGTLNSAGCVGACADLIS